MNITTDGVRMPEVKEAMHVGILRFGDSQESVMNYNIGKSRRTTYCLMEAGIHGHTGLDPDTSAHILQTYPKTYILPLLVEVLLTGKTLMANIERFYKKLLNYQIQWFIVERVFVVTTGGRHQSAKRHKSHCWFINIKSILLKNDCKRHGFC